MTGEIQRPTVPAPFDLPAAILRSGALSAGEVEDIRAEVDGGRYPRDPRPLATRLVRDGVLTEYQARCLFHRKPQGLAIGRYVILDQLGKGAMGKVFKARHDLMGRVVALKVVLPRVASRTNAAVRFEREMRLVARLDHPHVVRAFDADRVGKVSYIVMEYVPGQDLARRLQEHGPLPHAEVVRHAAQAAAGLAHAHGRGVIHRDVKPSNLLLGDDGVVRLLDFGLGILAESDADDRGSFASVDGAVIGTVDFLSPEQAAGRPADGRSDLFGLGCTMYHLMTGELPFPGDSLVERMARRILGPPEPIRAHLPEVPAGVVEVMGRLMATRPEDRYQDAAEAVAALRAIVHLGDVAASGRRAAKRQEESSAAPDVVVAAAPEVKDDPRPTVVTSRMASPPSSFGGRTTSRVALCLGCLAVTFVAGFALSLITR